MTLAAGGGLAALLACAAAAADGCALGAPGPAGSAPPSGTDDRDGRALARIERPPLGLPAPPAPPGPRPSAARIRLGRKLFLDRRLSNNGTLSCAMCHVPEQGFTSNELQTAVGNEGKSLPRNAPTLLNVAYAAPFFHDGREPALELQPFDVFLNPDEMAAPSLGAVVAKISRLPDYPGLFEQAFGTPPAVEAIGQALGSYLRTLLSANSPFDRWRFGGEAGAVSEPVKRGFRLFTGRAGCSACHAVGEHHALFTDHRFHDTGIGWQAASVHGQATGRVRVELAPGVFAEMDRALVNSVGRPLPNDLGRYGVTGDPTDRWRFKTPSLRNVALTAPYMHDGSFSSLREVVALYDRGAIAHEGLDPRLRPLGLDEQEREDLVAFLGSLTGDNLQELVADARSEPVRNPE